MNKLIRKAAALITAGFMTASCLSLESFAESAGTGSEKVSITFAASVAKPTYKIKGSSGVRRIQLFSDTSGAEIYYTTNGSTPTVRSKKYTAGTNIKITKTTKIKAIAVKGAVQSSVMTKTVSVATLYGDVTGDGKVNSTDYTRLKNYINGKTTFVCKDNADCNGSGGISSKDLTVLSQYLSGKIDSLPNKGLATVNTPKIVIYTSYGGKRVELSSTQSGAQFYYTLNGSTPTTSSTKYPSGGIQLTSSVTLKVISVVDGESSAVRTVDIDVGTTPDVTSDYATNTTYDREIKVTLRSNASTASRIYYTTDGSSPITSSTRKLYSSGVTISSDTTLKAYAQSKGNVDSGISTFDYRVNANFSISGAVWDDTYGNTVISDGKRTSNSTEPGISGITVYLITSNTTPADAPKSYYRKTTTDTYGEYSFTELTKGNSYRVVFEYNAQKYRANNTKVAGGNMAYTVSPLGNLTIKNGGAYVNESLFLNVNNYTDAAKSTDYNLLAATDAYFTDTTKDVSFALMSKNYGNLNIAIAPSGHNSKDNTIGVGKSMSYVVTLTNNSPMAITTLSDITIDLYLTQAFGTFRIDGSSGIYSLTDRGTLSNGYRQLTLSGLTSSAGLAAGKSVTCTLTSSVIADVGAQINAYAEISAYRFSTSCYDQNSIPGNLTVGVVREKDEAKATTLTVVSGDSDSSSTSTKKTISAVRKDIKLGLGESYTDAFIVVIHNATSKNDALIGASEGTSIVYSCTYNLDTANKDLYILFTVVASDDITGVTRIPVYIRGDNSKMVTLTATIVEDPVLA